MKILKSSLLHLILLLLITPTINAHVGGHGTADNLREWFYENDQLAFKGSFLFVENDKVYIESNDHKVVNVKDESLSEKDRNYITQRKIDIEKLNSGLAPQSKTVTITQWNYTSLVILLLYGVLFGLILIQGYKIFKTVKNNVSKTGVSVVSLFLCAVLAIACDKESDDVTTTTATTVTIDPSDPAYMAAAFSGFSNVSTSFDTENFYIESNGFPEYDDMMEGITAWIDQVPAPQFYNSGDLGAWSIPLSPTLADSPISIEGHFQKGAIGIAVNGIPIFNPINASGLVSKQIGELDAYGGHAGRGDDYHYHTAPLHLDASQGVKPIAYALDGFAVYGSLEPDGTSMNSLDAYHGHTWGNSYHYHGTTDYPYMIGSMRGNVTLSGTAPEDQVTPQPVGKAFRSELHPMTNPNGTTLINSCIPNGTGNGYTITYTADGNQGSVEYSWDSNDLFTFIFIDTDGTTTTETHQR